MLRPIGNSEALESTRAQAESETAAIFAKVIAEVNESAGPNDMTIRDGEFVVNVEGTKLVLDGSLRFSFSGDLSILGHELESLGRVLRRHADAAFLKSINGRGVA